MRIAVTGANGFIGRQLCPYLQEHLNADIVAMMRNPDRAGEQILNLSDSDENLIARLGNLDCLIHLAARAHSIDSTQTDFDRDNLLLSQRIAHLCDLAKIPRLIFLSSIKVNGDSTQGRAPYSADEKPQPKDAYGASKLASEQAIRKRLENTQTRVVIIRPPLVYGDHNKGNLGSLGKLIRLRIPLPFGKLKNKRDLVSIENLCSLIALVTTHPQAVDQIFLVSDGISRTTGEIANLLAEREGIRTTSFSMPDWTFNLLGLIKPQMIERLTGDLQVDINKTLTLLGWKPHSR